MTTVGPRPQAVNGARRCAVAFVSTAFGFGPASKAVTIARAMLAADPDVELHYFGDGIDLEFAVAAQAFDEVVGVSADEPGERRALVARLRDYDAVVSVLNFAVAQHWAGAGPPLYLVDSLAWMWDRIPAGVEFVNRYFVQDYLIERARVDDCARQAPLELVAPIDAAASDAAAAPREKEDRLLVNLSGCASPLASDGYYERYASVVAKSAVRVAGDRFASIVIACNSRLAELIRRDLGPHRGVTVGHYAPDEFLALLASSRVVLSAPGITTTIEAIRLGAPIRFLLPQNYSQALISERYRALVGDAATMALSRFGSQFAVAADLDEPAGVARTVQSVQTILTTARPALDEALADLLSAPERDVTEILRTQRLGRWDRPGQEQIAARVLGEMSAGHAA